MANFKTKTIKEIFDSFMSKYTTLRAKYGDTSPLLEKSFVKTIGYAIAGIAATLWQLAVWIYKQCFPQTCELSVLKLWGDLVDVTYNQGQNANLTILLNKVSASYLASGTIYKNLETGLIYKTISQANTENGQIIATVQCTTPKEIGNLQTGTMLHIANPLDGIPSTATVVETKIEGTSDEDVEVYRKRVLTRYRSRAQGGSALDYYNWGMEVQGIVDVLPYVLTEGLVSIYLVGLGSGRNRNVSGSLTPNPFPVWNDGVFQEFSGSGLLLQVAKSIEGSEDGLHDRRPMTARVQLLQPFYSGYSISITGLTDTSFSQQIKEALVSIFDTRRPHIQVLNYKPSIAKINKQSLSATVQEIIGEETFTKFILTNAANKEIDEETLGIGTLAYLSNLTINGTQIEV